MLSNPLFWMELQFLGDTRRAELANILPVWKEHRSVLSSADVLPIGERPDGTSHSGFYLSVDGSPKYLLLFREYNDRKSATYSLPADISGAELLATNGDVSLDVCGREINASFDQPRTYAFYKLS